MPERPLLLLPSPGVPIARAKRTPAFGRSHLPTRGRQAERLSPLFTRLQETFDARRARLRAEAVGLAPEDVVVLETIGNVSDFLAAVRKISGMEWLGEIEEEDIPADDDFFAFASDGITRKDKPLRGRLFMVFANQQALQQMLALWNSWSHGQPLPRGLRKWNHLFTQLRNIRPWNVNDRLFETGVLEDWHERVAHNQEVIPCEIELWFRKNPQQRQNASRRITALVTSLQGQVLHETTIEEISYHALLVRLPLAAVRQVLDQGGQDTSLVQCEQIQFFRATGQMNAVCPNDYQAGDEELAAPPAEELGQPVIALFDGLPLQNHNRLAGRLVIDDPDDFEGRYTAAERQHGTAMAFLILHGDLNEEAPPLNRRLYVRPILCPDQRDWRPLREESAPEGVIVTDLIHRAVRRLFEGEGALTAVAPQICVINLSIGIRDRFFNGSLSPFARLLDWLSWKYGVLFVVSAGNHPHNIEINMRRGQFEQLPAREIQSQVIRAIAADARHRRLLSPAEAVNVLTIGSVHHDASGVSPVPRAIHPFIDGGLPSIINAQGMGFRRAIKPDIFLPGGRTVLVDNLNPSPNAQYGIYTRGFPPGQCVAFPGATPGDLNGTLHTRGTSNATALASRTASILYDVVEDLRNEPGGAIIDEVPRALWLKTMIVHAASWGNASAVLGEVLRTPQNSRRFSEYITRLLGYGALDADRVNGCTPFRVTALGGGLLGADEAHVHRMPLPPSLSGRQGWRRLILTLTWFTPINSSHQAWRQAAIWFSPPSEQLQVERQEASWQAVQRGTVQHEILEGDRASVFLDGDNLEVNVNCRSDAGTLEEAVPYTLAITLEVAQEIGIDIYNEVKVRVQPTRVDIAPQA